MREASDFGPYVIHERIGVGGMAEVHRGEQVSDQGFRRSLALKRMLPAVASDPGFVQAFVQEARLASLLHHDNIAQTYELGQIDDRYYIAMEYVPGPTLTQVMTQCASAAGAIPLPIVVNVLIQICDALDYAHNLHDANDVPLGIIHRDVSPGNIIVSSTGIVKLIDFGIAKASTAKQQTQVGVIKGKFAYVAPEYTVGHLDARADLFAVGVIAHELLTNRRLFQAKNDVDTIGNVRQKPIQPPSRWDANIPRDLDDIVMTALQRNPAMRWQSAAAMRTALAGVARELGAVVGSHQIQSWIVWAFSQVPRRDESTLARLFDALEPSVSCEMMFEQAELAVDAVPVVPIARGSTTHPIARPIARPTASASRWVWRCCVAALVAIAIGAAAWARISLDDARRVAETIAARV